MACRLVVLRGSSPERGSPGGSLGGGGWTHCLVQLYNCNQRQHAVCAATLHAPGRAARTWFALLRMGHGRARACTSIGCLLLGGQPSWHAWQVRRRLLAAPACCSSSNTPPRAVLLAAGSGHSTQPSPGWSGLRAVCAACSAVPSGCALAVGVEVTRSRVVRALIGQASATLWSCGGCSARTHTGTYAMCYT